MCGESVGIGELAASWAENTTLMGWPPFAAREPLAGETDTTCSGPVGCGSAFLAGDLVVLVVLAADRSAVCIGAAWLPGATKVAIATPATSTSPAQEAVSTLPRRRKLAGIDASRRNLPKRDTAFPSTC